MIKRNIRNSKRLAWLLRHGKPEETGLIIRTDGFAEVENVLEKFDNLSLQELVSIVEHDEKGRFKIVSENGKMLIRANQGHSFSFLNYEKLLTKIDLKSLSRINEKIIIHGTKLSKWEMIKNEGLSKMNRSHINFISALDFKMVNILQRPKDIDSNMTLDQVVSRLCKYKCEYGIRPSCNVIILIDMTNHSLTKRKIEFFKSSNGIILSSGNSDGIIGSDMFLLCIDIEHGIELMNNTHNLFDRDLVELLVNSISFTARPSSNFPLVHVNAN